MRLAHMFMAPPAGIYMVACCAARPRTGVPVCTRPGTGVPGRPRAGIPRGFPLGSVPAQSCVRRARHSIASSCVRRALHCIGVPGRPRAGIPARGSPRIRPRPGIPFFRRKGFCQGLVNVFVSFWCGEFNPPLCIGVPGRPRAGIPVRGSPRICPRTVLRPSRTSFHRTVLCPSRTALHRTVLRPSRVSLHRSPGAPARWGSRPEFPSGPSPHRPASVAHFIASESRGCALEFPRGVPLGSVPAPSCVRRVLHCFGVPDRPRAGVPARGSPPMRPRTALRPPEVPYMPYKSFIKVL